MKVAELLESRRTNWRQLEQLCVQMEGRRRRRLGRGQRRVLPPSIGPLVPIWPLPTHTSFRPIRSAICTSWSLGAQPTLS